MLIGASCCTTLIEVSFLTYCPPNSFNGKSLVSCPYFQQKLQIVCKSLHSFIKWPSLWHFWHNMLHQYPSSHSLEIFLLSFFCSSLANSSSKYSLFDNGWERLLLCGVCIFSSISLAKLATSTIIDLGMGIPIKANFNFFISLSLKVSFKYTSFGCCGVIAHNYKNLS